MKIKPAKVKPVAGIDGDFEYALHALLTYDVYNSIYESRLGCKRPDHIYLEEALEECDLS